jgi:hypothetical protein
MMHRLRLLDLVVSVAPIQANRAAGSTNAPFRTTSNLVRQRRFHTI